MLLGRAKAKNPSHTVLVQLGVQSRGSPRGEAPASATLYSRADLQRTRFRSQYLESRRLTSKTDCCLYGLDNVHGRIGVKVVAGHGAGRSFVEGDVTRSLGYERLWTKNGRMRERHDGINFVYDDEKLTYFNQFMICFACQFDYVRKYTAMKAS